MRICSFLPSATEIVAALGLAGTLVGVSEENLGYLLAAYAGFFLYMGATDLLPEAHSHPSWRRVALTVVGFVATFGIVLVATR